MPNGQLLDTQRRGLTTLLGNLRSASRPMTLPDNKLKRKW